MKKTLLIILSSLTCACAMAEGYQINTLSTRQIALGHTGVSQKLDAQSMYFNPAAMAYMSKSLDLSMGITGIDATATCTTEGKKYETDNGVSTPLYGYAGFKIYDNLKAGIAFYTPYGSAINWTENWPGAILSQKVNLKTYTIQPTFSYKINEKLAIGAGLTISWGSVDLNKALVIASSMDNLLAAMGKQYQFVDISPASVNLKGTTDLALGYNIGVMYNLNKKVTLGASFRSKVDVKVKSGIASVSYANEIATQLLQNSIGLINEANFGAEMPLPYTLTFGASYQVNKKLELSGDIQYTGWGAYKQLDINFLSKKLESLNQHLEKNYKNSWAFRFGAAYTMTNRLDLLGGINVDLTPVKNNYYNPDTPGMTKISPSLGISFKPLNGFAIDLSCAYVAGLGENNAKYTYVDLIYKSNPQLGKLDQQVFNGSYTVHAITPSLGIRYSF